MSRKQFELLLILMCKVEKWSLNSEIIYERRQNSNKNDTFSTKILTFFPIVSLTFNNQNILTHLLLTIFQWMSSHFLLTASIVHLQCQWHLYENKYEAIKCHKLKLISSFVHQQFLNWELSEFFEKG